MKLADVIFTRSQIAELAISSETVPLPVLGYYQSRHTDGASFYIRTSEDEFKKCAEYASINRNFNFWPDVGCGQCNELICSALLLGNHGAVMDYIDLKEKRNDSQETSLYDVLLIKVAELVSIFKHYNIFYGISKARYNHNRAPRTIGICIRPEMSVSMFTHYFDQMEGLNDGDEDKATHLTGLGPITDYIMQCMEEDLGDRMPYAVQHGSTWNSVIREIQTPVPSRHVLERQCIDEMYSILADYLQQKRVDYLRSRGMNVETVLNFDPLTPERWDDIIQRIARGFSDSAVDELLKLATLKMATVASVFDEKTKGLREDVYGEFMGFMRDRLGDIAERSMCGAYRCLTPEEARKIIDIASALIGKTS